MTKRNESGKIKLLKGSMSYAWEELKTMNRKKFRALGKMIAGYVLMKFVRPKKSNQRSLGFSSDVS